MIRKIVSPPWLIALGLLALAAVAYGTLASRLGYYWDDWTIAWYIHFLGPGSFKEAFASDRPLLAWVYQLTTSLIGEPPLRWHVLAVITRWLAGFALWWALHGLWPQKPLQTASIAFLFTLYPGFKGQPIAITYGNVFIVLSLYLASWGAMLWAVRTRRRFRYLFPLSILLAAYSVFTAEHFFGLEMLRPVLLWLTIKSTAGDAASERRPLRRTFLLWLPYLLIDALFLAWRFSHPTPRAQIILLERLRGDPPGALLALLQTALQDVLTASLQAWKQVFELPWLGSSAGAAARNSLLVAVIAAGVAGAVLAFLRRAEKTSHTAQARRGWALGVTLLGLFALLVAGIPVWPTNLHISLDFPWDRFTLPFMLGAALLLVGLIELTAFFRYQSVVLVSLLCGLAAGLHYTNALTYRLDWLAQRDFFWQLTWRAPGIQPGTILLTSEIPFDYEWDNSLTAPLNWTYAPDLAGRSLPYLVYDAEGRLSSGQPALDETTIIREQHRITPFDGSIARTIVIFYRPPSACLKVIDPQVDMNLPDKPRYFREIAGFSDPGLILAEAQPPAKPPLQFFGPEPEPGWCYYFEKAELARQNRDWAEIVRLGEEALPLQREIGRKNASELLPFVEGYARMGEWEQAAHLTELAYTAVENLRTPLCSLWGGFQEDASLAGQGRATLQDVSNLLKCEAETP